MDDAVRDGLLQRVESALEEVRPHLAVDGGDVSVVDLSDDFVVHIQWEGNCQNCDMSFMTLRAGIEQAVISRVPEITSVVAVN